ncbi:putative diguanylate cyclase AdrA [compost metagenome]
MGYEQSPALTVSLSIGLAAFNPAHTDATQWLNDADLALYEAKATGRNRVICCSDGKSHHEILDSV